MTFFKKHWKKIVMALFACFWAGCYNDSETEVQALYGCIEPVDVDTTLTDEDSITDSSTEVIALYGAPQYNEKESAEEETSSSADSSK